MKALLDVNVLIALLDSDHVHHADATDWLANNVEGGWASCPLTQNGCIRIMSQPRYPNALQINDIIGRLQKATSTPYHSFIGDNISLLSTDAFDHLRLLISRQITDIYLLALAVENGCCFVTFDQSIPIAASKRAGAESLVVI